MYIVRLIKVVSACLLCTLSLNFYAQTLDVEILRYKLINGEAYVDVIIDLSASNMKMELLDSVWHSYADITVIVENGGEIITFKKTLLEGPFSTDSIEAWTAHHLHVERILLQPDNYRINVDVNDGANTYQEDIEIHLGGMPEISDLMIVEAYYNTSEGNETRFTKSGIEIIPLIGKEIALEAEQVRFYAELYNIDQVVGEDSLFLLTFGLTGSDGRLSPLHTRHLRLKAESIIPVFEFLPVDYVTPPLSGGLLKVIAKTRDGDEIVSIDYPLNRWTGDNHDNSPNIVQFQYPERLKTREQLYRHLEDHLPLASHSEQTTILGILKITDDIQMMKGFLERFWTKRNPENPQLSWRRYTADVTVVDSVFGGCRNGHGADTDQGYVYLKYGKPNTIVKRLHGTDYYPYEIWHYHHTVGFTNRRFLFYAPHVVAECLEILHSDMPGEMKNEDWLSILRSRENRLRIVDSQMNRLNPHDTNSREEPEDLFYNPR